jgi:tungstate transport system ATP-binding protein
MNGRSPLIELDRASVRFGDRVALRDVSLAVHAGERLALVGANGSGKTTLLRLLHGQLPDHGRRRVRTTAGGQAPRQAMLYQRPFLLRLSVRQNLLVALWLAGVPRPERGARALAALRRVGLDDVEDRPARVLSGGQQQRVALARAWAVRPDVLLLDEPTASLDPPSRQRVEELIVGFAAEGMAIVLSSHSLGQVNRVATRVIHLDEGRLSVDLPTGRFFAEALPPAAARFVQGELP